MASQGFRNGRMLKKMGNPVAKFEAAESLAEKLEENGVLEEHGNSAEETVLDGDCCGDGTNLSQGAEAVSGRSQLPNHDNTSLPSEAGNTLKRIVDIESVTDYVMDPDKILAFIDTDGLPDGKAKSVSYYGGDVQESQDMKAWTPIGDIRNENFEFGNLELIRKSLKLNTSEMGQSEIRKEICSLKRQTKPLKTKERKPGVKKISEMKFYISEQAKMDVANKWARGNSLLVRLISKLRSEATVATIVDNLVDGEKNPDGPEEKNSDAVMEADQDLGNEDGCEEFLPAKLGQLDETSWDSFNEVSKQLEEPARMEEKVIVACEEDFANPGGDVKLSQEEFLQVFAVVLQILGFAAELLVLGGLARSDISLQGKLESVEMDVAKDRELCSEKA